jgi:hypothetical protein
MSDETPPENLNQNPGSRPGILSWVVAGSAFIALIGFMIFG